MFQRAVTVKYDQTTGNVLSVRVSHTRWRDIEQARKHYGTWSVVDMTDDLHFKPCPEFITALESHFRRHHSIQG